MKHFTTALLALGMAGAAYAAGPVAVQPKYLPVQGLEKHMCIDAPVFSGELSQPLSRAEKYTINYSPAGAPYSATMLNGTTANMQMAQAFEITAEKTAEFAGSEITGFYFYTPVNGQSNQNQIRNFTLFLTYDLEDEPFYTQAIALNNTNPLTLTNVALDTPYTIEDGKAVYVGIKYKTTSKYDYTIVFDYMYHDDIVGGWIATYDAAGKATWINVTDEIGYICLGVTIEGENLPVNKMATLDIECPPVVVAGREFEIDAIFQNNGANSVTSFKMQYTVGDDQPYVVQYTSTNGLSYGTMAMCGFEAKYNKPSADDVTVKAKIVEVNGIAVSDDAGVETVMICIPENSGYPKQVVIEEITGTWCRWCPAGIVAMEEIRENYPDGGLIPVCVHADDELSAPSWENVANMASGVPSAFLNRQLDVYPSYEELVAGYEELKATPALGKIDITAEVAEGPGKAVNITATTEFLFDLADAADRYILAFGVTEDGLGPYDQQNAYSGGASGPCGGFENLPSPTPVVYNDVAILLTTFNGISGSVPASVKAGQKYTFQRKLSLSSSVNLDKIHVIGYLLNRAKGTVENACTVKNVAGVEDAVAADSNAGAPVEYFNLQGVRVDNPSSGLFIRRQGTSTGKVLIR